MEEKQTVVAMVDGSSAAERAFELALLITRRSKAFNFFSVVHVYDPKAVAEKEAYKPEYIEQHFKNSLLTQFPKDRYRVHVV